MVYLCQYPINKQRTRRTPKAFATPAKVTSECNGPTPPYMNTCTDNMKNYNFAIQLIP